MAGPFCFSGCRLGPPLRFGLFFLAALWGEIGLSQGVWPEAHCGASRTPAITPPSAISTTATTKRPGADSRAKRTSASTPQGPWIDSICYETMMGECLYELGDLSEALQHYTQALELVKAFPDWMLRVQFPAIQPAGASLRRAIPWGAARGGQNWGPSQGHDDLPGADRHHNDDPTGWRHGHRAHPGAHRRGRGIVRCTTLAIRRRTKLLGPLAAARSVVQAGRGRPVAAHRTAQSLVAGLGGGGTGRGAGGHGPRGSGPHRPESRWWPAANSTIRSPASPSSSWGGWR